jgi:hypothetical protein
VRSFQALPEDGVPGVSEPGARRCYGGLKIPPTPGLKVRRFGHGERRGKACKKVTVILAMGHTLRAHEALSRLMRWPASLRLSIASSRTVSSLAMTNVYR